MRTRFGYAYAGARRRDDRAVRAGFAAGWPGIGSLAQRAPALLLSAASVCAWWVAVPPLLDLDLPCPVLLLGACLLVPVAAFRQWALATTDGQVKRGEEVRPVLGTATFVLAAAAVLVSPAPVIAYASGCPLPTAVGLVLASDLGAVLLAPAVAHLAAPPS